ncbi:hypothetical protein AQUSIP_24040 [Aquicella siphonis]|uniref:Uncharacterized protein n=1 Tax=Aquicella siphonis TaxID=254247 RepID=A0A5E4PL00_9COXI|nr:hypothetical protein AQUSIP_24040 [Aquicella siphonis]
MRWQRKAATVYRSNGLDQTKPGIVAAGKANNIGQAHGIILIKGCVDEYENAFNDQT